MDWSSFDDCFGKLKTALRDTIENDKNAYKVGIYVSYLDYGSEIRFIVQRIEAEAQRCMELSKKVMEMIRIAE